MGKIAFALAWLTYAGSGCKGQVEVEQPWQLQESRCIRAHKPITAFAAFLLARNPRAGWQAGSPLALGGQRLAAFSLQGSSGHCTQRGCSPSMPMRLRKVCMQNAKDEEDSSKFSLSSILPSIPLILFGALLFTSINNLIVSKPLAIWLANGAQLSSFPLKAVGPELFLGPFALYQLLKFGGIFKADFYDKLEGLDVNSLSSQAGSWALAGVVPTTSDDGKYEVATFAGGCFWGTELHFQRVPGVLATCVGYTQGRVEKPSYDQVCGGLTGHTEGIQMLYDPEVISYDFLCDKLLSTVDSTLLNQVGNDRGTQYRHGIYPHTEAQREAAKQAIAREQDKIGTRRKVVTEVVSAKVFWPAEKYHQRYLQKGGQSAAKNAQNPVRCYG